MIINEAEFSLSISLSRLLYSDMKLYSVTM